MLNDKGFRQSFFFTVLTFLLIIAPFLLSCGGGSSGGDGDNGSNDNSGVSETFTNAGLSLTAETAEAENSRSVVVTDSEGDVVLSAEATTTEVTINFPGSTTPYIVSLDEPLNDLPSAFEMNRMGTYIAGQLVDKPSKAFYPMDLPGCDWFPDTLCTLGCCADHDQCYDENGCSVTSWFQIGASLECRNCNDTVVSCILRGCYYTGVSRDNDSCYDNECDTYYDCDGVSCECTSPCDQEICDNGVDDDGDTYTDCEDADCIEHVACIEICDNGIDDDGDTLIDCQDGDCLIEGICNTYEQSTGLTLKYLLVNPPPYTGTLAYCEDNSGNLLTAVVGGLLPAEVIKKGEWDPIRNGWWDTEVLTCGSDVPKVGILTIVE